MVRLPNSPPQVGYPAGSLKFEHKRDDGLIAASGLIIHDIYTVQIKLGPGTSSAPGTDLHQDESLPGARLALILAEPGVRFIQLSRRDWDHLNNQGQYGI